MVQSPDLTKFSTLVDLTRWQAENNPDRSLFTYVADGENKEIDLTFKQVDQKARSLAALLQSKSSVGDRALLLYSSGLEFIIGFFGCLYAGVIPVLANPPRPNASVAPLKAVVKDCGAALALTNQAFYALIKDQVSEDGLAQIIWTVTDDLPAESNDLKWQMPEISKDSLALIIYSSGSTSEPKGVMLSHGKIIRNMNPIIDRYSITTESVFVNWAPLFHIGGVIWPIINLSVGFRIFHMPTQAFIERPTRWLRLMSKHHADISFTFNFALQTCIDQISQDDLSSLDFSSWRICAIGGERVRADILERFSRHFSPSGFQSNIFSPSYGSTEIFGGTSVKRPEQYKTYRLDQASLENNKLEVIEDDQQKVQIHVGCGSPNRVPKVIIVDPNSLKVLSPGQIGEIWVDTVATGEGYWNKPEATAYYFNAYTADTHEGPYYRTSDMGGIIDNSIIITGRIKDLIILHGKNYYSQDFEKTVEPSHPALVPGGIAAVAINQESEEQLAIVCEVKPDLPGFDAEAIIKSVRNAVAREQQRSVSVVALVKAGTLPRTANGKLQRFKVQKDLVEGRLEAIRISRIESQPTVSNKENADYLAPSTPIERALVGIWQGVFKNVERIGVNDDFLELGGDSIQGTQILTQIQEVFQIEISPRALFEKPTIKEMAKQILEKRQHPGKD